MGRKFGSSPDTTGNHHYFRMAVAGPMARTIDDIELGWKALIKPWHQNNQWLEVDENKTLDQYKVAYLDEWKFGNDKIPVSSSVKEKLNNLVSALKSKGVETDNVQPIILQKCDKCICSLWLIWSLPNNPGSFANSSNKNFQMELLSKLI
ncbi:MAG: hypothetical protein IPH36_19540 [Saprospiraceae bacterium]|nr:hypothetical protein [Saprospiraceae bacterium]